MKLDEYTVSQEDLKNFKIIRNRGLIFAIALITVEIVLYILTAGEVIERGFFKYITVISCNIAASLIVIAITGAISHEADVAIRKFHTKEIKQNHLNFVKKRWPVIAGYILALLNEIFGFATALGYARYYSTWWLWIITVLVLSIIILGFFCQYWLLSSIEADIKKAQNDIDHLIEMERRDFYVEP